MNSTWRLAATLAVAPAYFSAFGQEHLTRGDYKATDYMIPMRDGAKLHTIVVAPSHSKLPLPFMFSRTPYGVEGFSEKSLGPWGTDEGFIYVVQDIRGRHKSEGEFVMMRPTKGKSGAKVDEGTDAYDTLDWLVKHIANNNARAAMSGTSYDGWTTLQAAINPHPALKLVIPEASPMDMFLNDDFHRNGAFRLSYGFEYCYMMEASRDQNPFKFDIPDNYEWYLKLGALSHVNEKYFHGTVPTWNGFTEHPTHDSYWTDQSVADLLSSPKVPILNVGGFWDQEDPWGPQETYRLLSRRDPHHQDHIFIGPWNHGGWTGSKLGAIDFGPLAGSFHTDLIRSSSLFYLKDRGNGPLPSNLPDDFSVHKQGFPAAIVFESGTNKWRGYDAWPPKEAVKKKLYLGADHSLAFHATGSGAPDTYVSNPADPVPYRKRPIEPNYGPVESGWWTWQIQDQQFLRDRKDILIYETEPLTANLTITGNVVANLFASTSGTDSDWIVKLIDEYPKDGSNLSGYQLPLNMEVVRSRFRKSLTAPEPVKANQPYEYKIDLHATSHTFLKGHRVMVQVQSTWFPLIDRNPQKFVPNIYKASDDDYQSATQSVFHDPAHASCIELPVIQKG